MRREGSLTMGIANHPKVARGTGISPWRGSWTDVGGIAIGPTVADILHVTESGVIVRSLMICGDTWMQPQLDVERAWQGFRGGTQKRCGGSTHHATSTRDSQSFCDQSCYFRL